MIFKERNFSNISNNRIGNDGPAKLSPALQNHPTLHTLKIGLNPLGDEGVQTILKAASKNTSIQCLSFAVSEKIQNSHF